MPDRRIVLATTLLVCTALAGCQNVRSFLQGSGGGDAPGTIEPTPAQLSELERLAIGSYQEQIDLFTAIESARIANPTDTNRLRYALALSVLDHPSSDLVAAHTELEALLEADNGLTLSQTQLASIVFRNVERMLTLGAQNDGLRSDVERLESSRSASSSRADARLQGVQRKLNDLEKDNERLQAELAEARRQLDAILSIETATDRNN